MIGDEKIENLTLKKESAHFEIELQPFDFLYVKLGLEDAVKLLRITSESANDMCYLRFQY